MSKDRAFDYQQQAHKPVVHYIQSDIPIDVGQSAWIYPIDHPSVHVSNTSIVKTSKVVAINEDGFETVNSIYKLK
jgi:uncharacterized protein YabE (DUF348 family)